MSSYEINLNGKELKFFLFSKKIYPKCSHKLTKKREKTLLASGWHKTRPLSWSCGKKYNVEIIYECHNCNFYSNIHDLSIM